MKKAFTLIELLVVVLIIGILSAVALPQYRMAVIKTRYATVKTLTRNIANDEELFYIANGYYTSDFNNLDIRYNDSVLTVCNVGHTSILSKVYCEDVTDRLRYEIYLLHSAYVPGAKKCVVLNSISETELRRQLCKAETGDSSPGISRTDFYYTYW